MTATAPPRRLRAAEPPTVLVAGAAGFVGSHLCERVLAQGHRVLAMDNLSTGDVSQVAHLFGHPRFEFILHDITAPLPPAARAARQVYNLACPASPAYCQREPVATLLASLLGTWRLLELCSETGARLLQASTSEIYGDPQMHPQPETYWGHVNPIGPRACYDEGKRGAEALCVAYAQERGVQVRVARLFNCYGPRLRPGDGRVVSNFVTQALTGQPLTVYGTGQQTRSFCFVSDTVEGLLRLMASDCTEPVNLGNPQEHTVLELAALVLRLVGSESPVEFHGLPVDDPVRRRPDIARARQHLHWSPQVSLPSGLMQTIEHIRTQLARDAAPQQSRRAGMSN